MSTFSSGAAGGSNSGSGRGGARFPGQGLTVGGGSGGSGGYSLIPSSHDSDAHDPTSLV
jgi:hypothetical protein